MELKPITRTEKILDAIAKGSSVDFEPITREEMFLVKAGGMDVQTPNPITRKERFLSNVSVGGAKEEEAVTVALNLANGNQTVLPSEGKVLSSVTIEKPATLLPENVAEGVDIAGVIGTLAASGGGIKFACGSFTPTSKYNYVFTHDLGVVPDFVFVYSTGSSTSVSVVTIYVAGVSNAFESKYGASINKAIGYAVASGDKYWYDQGSIAGIDTVSEMPLNSANESTIRIGTMNMPLTTSHKYRWFAFGGLT